MSCLVAAGRLKRTDVPAAASPARLEWLDSSSQEADAEVALRCLESLSDFDEVMPMSPLGVKPPRVAVCIGSPLETPEAKRKPASPPPVARSLLKRSREIQEAESTDDERATSKMRREVRCN